LAGIVGRFGIGVNCKLEGEGPLLHLPVFRFGVPRHEASKLSVLALEGHTRRRASSSGLAPSSMASFNQFLSSLGTWWSEKGSPQQLKLACFQRRNFAFCWFAPYTCERVGNSVGHTAQFLVLFIASRLRCFRRGDVPVHEVAVNLPLSG
jgi:hypothetical protein